jgi:hypothetical protein
MDAMTIPAQRARLDFIVASSAIDSLTIETNDLLELSQA